MRKVNCNYSHAFRVLWIHTLCVSRHKECVRALGLVKNAGCHEKVQLHGNIAQKIDFLGAFWRMVATHGDNTHVEDSFKNTDSQVEKCKSQ